MITHNYFQSNWVLPQMCFTSRCMIILSNIGNPISHSAEPLQSIDSKRLFCTQFIDSTWYCFLVFNAFVLLLNRHSKINYERSCVFNHRNNINQTILPYIHFLYFEIMFICDTPNWKLQLFCLYLIYPLWLKCSRVYLTQIWHLLAYSFWTIATFDRSYV